MSYSYLLKNFVPLYSHLCPCPYPCIIGSDNPVWSISSFVSNVHILAVIYVLIFSLGQKMLKLCCPFSGKVGIKNFLLFSIRAIFPLFRPLLVRKMPSSFVCFFFLCLMNCKLKKKKKKKTLAINNFWYPYSIYHFWYHKFLRV